MSENKKESNYNLTIFMGLALRVAVGLLFQEERIKFTNFPMNTIIKIESRII